MTTTSPIDTTATAPRVRRPRFGFALAVVTQIAMMMGASAPSPFYPVLAAEIGFDAIVISAVFAVYAVALLLALLTAGSLSDHVGRRPVAIGGLLVLAASMVLFWHADTVATLMLARILQGAASGVLIAALSAAALDLAPGGRSRVAALWNALSPGIGLALGALVSGIALDVTGQPLLDVFAPLTAVYIVLAGLFFLAPETAPLRPGALASLSFRLSVPAGIRSDFWRGAPRSSPAGRRVDSSSHSARTSCAPSSAVRRTSGRDSRSRCWPASARSPHSSSATGARAPR